MWSLPASPLVQPLLRALLGLMLLPYDALVYLDAILRSAFSMLVTRRGLAGLAPPLLRPAERSAQPG